MSLKDVDKLWARVHIPKQEKMSISTYAWKHVLNLPAIVRLQQFSGVNSILVLYSGAMLGVLSQSAHCEILMFLYCIVLH
jgi:hypothetical protein